MGAWYCERWIRDWSSSGRMDLTGDDIQEEDVEGVLIEEREETVGVVE